MVWLFGREARGTLAPHAGVEPTPCPGRRTAREASQMFSDVLKHKSCLTPPAKPSVVSKREFLLLNPLSGVQAGIPPA